MLLRPRQQPRRGVAAVEFAFVAPVLVVILLGLWEVGRHHPAAAGPQQRRPRGRPPRRPGPDHQQHRLADPDPGRYRHAQRQDRPSSTTCSQAGLNVTDGRRDRRVRLHQRRHEPRRSPTRASRASSSGSRCTMPLAQAAQWTTLRRRSRPTELTASVDWTCLVDDPFTLDTDASPLVRTHRGEPPMRIRSTAAASGPPPSSRRPSCCRSPCCCCSASSSTAGSSSSSRWPRTPPARAPATPSPAPATAPRMTEVRTEVTGQDGRPAERADRLRRSTVQNVNPDTGTAIPGSELERRAVRRGDPGARSRGTYYAHAARRSCKTPTSIPIHATSMMRSEAN